MVDPTRLCQIEVQVSDLKAAAQFYEQAFGWRVMPADLHEYVVLEVPDGCPYGISLTPRRQHQRSEATRWESSIVLYFAVDDPEEVVRRVERAGGKKRFGPMPLMGYGAIYQVEDLDGTRFGLYLKKTTAR
jgi:predicted enzyme related to lactoylglutathione lyase